MKIIYPCTAANYFKVNDTSYLYKQTDDIAEKVASFISSKQDVIKSVCECGKNIDHADIEHGMCHKCKKDISR